MKLVIKSWTKFQKMTLIKWLIKNNQNIKDQKVKSFVNTFCLLLKMVSMVGIGLVQMEMRNVSISIVYLQDINWEKLEQKWFNKQLTFKLKSINKEITFSHKTNQVILDINFRSISYFISIQTMESRKNLKEKITSLNKKKVIIKEKGE